MLTPADQRLHRHCRSPAGACLTDISLYWQISRITAVVDWHVHHPRRRIAHRLEKRVSATRCRASMAVPGGLQPAAGDPRGGPWSGPPTARFYCYPLARCWSADRRPARCAGDARVPAYSSSVRGHRRLYWPAARFRRPPGSCARAGAGDRRAGPLAAGAWPVPATGRGRNRWITCVARTPRSATSSRLPEGGSCGHPSFSCSRAGLQVPTSCSQTRRAGPARFASLTEPAATRQRSRSLSRRGPSASASGVRSYRAADDPRHRRRADSAIRRVRSRRRQLHAEAGAQQRHVRHVRSAREPSRWRRTGTRLRRSRCFFD